MNTVLAALLLFGTVDVKTAQKGDLYDDSVVVTNVNEAAFVKWGTTSGKTLRIDGGYVSPTVATGGVDLVGSALDVRGSAQYPAKVTYWPKNALSQGAYEVFGSGTGVYFPKNADMAAASVYGLQANYESLDERLTRKFGGVLTLDDDGSGNNNALRIGTRATGTAVGTYSAILGSQNEASAIGAIAGGYGSVAESAYSFTWGWFSHASSTIAIALGYEANATNLASFVWQGRSVSGEGSYGSHGSGTFNVNPMNGYSDFYVGNQSLADKFSQYVPVTGTPAGTTITGELAFRKPGSSCMNAITFATNDALRLATGTNMVVFSGETAGTAMDSMLVPDDSRVLTESYAKDAYPILTNSYTRADVNDMFLGTGETTVGSSFRVKYTDGTAKDLVSNTGGKYWEFGGRAEKAKGLAAYDSTNGSPTNPVATIGWSSASSVHVYEIRDANHTNAEAIASIADIDRKTAGIGGTTNRIESVDRLNAIYADGSWVTRTNATAGVAVTNTICTVSNVVTTVNGVKRKFYDAPLQVEWRFEAVNGEFMMIATTNVNTEVIQ